MERKTVLIPIYHKRSWQGARDDYAPWCALFDVPTSTEGSSLTHRYLWRKYVFCLSSFPARTHLMIQGFESPCHQMSLSRRRRGWYWFCHTLSFLRRTLPLGSSHDSFGYHRDPCFQCLPSRMFEKRSCLTENVFHDTSETVASLIGCSRIHGHASAFHVHKVERRLRWRKWSVTFNVPCSNGTILPVRSLISISIVWKLFRWSRT